MQYRITHVGLCHEECHDCGVAEDHVNVMILMNP